MEWKEMKSTKLTLISVTILALLLGASTFIIIGASTPIIAEQVKITPKPFDLENSDDVIVQVKLSIDDEPVVDQIDPDTVLLEGFIAPDNTWIIGAPPNFYAQFDGHVVANWVMVKISHMGITTPKPWVPIKITLKITGLLYNETPWEGTGDIKVFIPGNPTPPPPPPPP